MRLLFFLLALPLLAQNLRVSPNRRFLVTGDGQPFFWLGDTAWELFHRLNREEAERYLENRRMKGFNVTQAVVLAELEGLTDPNPYGHLPLENKNPEKPVEPYFRHVDWIIRKAAEKGLVIALLPTWSSYVTTADWNKTTPVIFNEWNARAYGKFLGARYKSARNLVWVLGGDRDPARVIPVWRAMAAGIREGGAKQVMTFHPFGGHSSSEWLHDESWLDFNMMQSGHGGADLPNWKMIAADYGRTPVKPTLDGEPRYENHPINWKPQELGWFDEYDVRKAAYWSVFAGGLGVTYGCHDIWQMLAPGRKPIGFARGAWQTSLDLPGAAQMIHLRKLIESRPMLERVPAPDLLVTQDSAPARHREAARGRAYAFVYTPVAAPFEVRLGVLAGRRIQASWFDPRTGATQALGEFPNEKIRTFTPPASPRETTDWVLVLDAKP